MTNQKNNRSILTGAIAGAVITAVSFSALIYTGLYPAPKGNEQSPENSEGSNKEPLYWVAPMDANYRRDKPGKSPMGMDLIPVYAEDSGGRDAGPGAIKISPEVVNNLGVRTAKVERKPLQRDIKTVGYVQYNEDLLVHLHPRVEGWIDKLFIKAEGDPVKKGQAVYELYSPALVNAQEELLLALERKNQRLIRAAEERLAALQISSNIVAEIQRSKKVKQTIRFYSPQDGVVDNLNIRQGFFVKPGTTLMSIGSLAQVWVEAEIFERQVPWVKVGMPVNISLDYLPGEIWEGKVDYIYPALDPKTRTVKVRLRFNNRDNLLKPNMFTQVTIHAASEQQRLVIPKEALIRTGAQDRVVLALEDGRFKSVAVKVGMQDESRVEILHGLSEGEKIVTSAQFLIDSESSKTSDFKRMQSMDDTETGVPDSVWVSATINSLMPGHRMINATHEAISEWDWPEMTMDFGVAESVDMAQLSEGMSLHIEISKNPEGQYVVTNVHIMDSHSDKESEATVSSAEVEGVINRINREQRMLNISRGPIEKWNRPAATLDFILADSIDIDSLSVGQKIYFKFEILEDFVIVKILGEKQQNNIEPATHQGDHQ
ncbi:efflux RND transporter periplasmic adaptor subunit [Aliikangiella sp. G2MR2-5]|uniref:efflux RND transporter periplasmic adaptor subunit n=1 Tax=Aliikangiella sp. G2MR2-5 TaxID=2788943 RepID=UPI0018A9755F|nr:efflux RND transporter periplasmic adaptor subunit [Aliikangiella sp. G2MR2-5]